MKNARLSYDDIIIELHELGVSEQAIEGAILEAYAEFNARPAGERDLAERHEYISGKLKALREWASSR